ncbi:uncharacterized protein LOC130918721 isoform X3 [Corythoichthys intestinalis]|uniref:uncharacterized protein LOC130918721 isoform X3 n=1 Tax=Corythoichthys intestinalis TaxID=161448 RepID=UPI0025A656EA|nr:uncharacterized protein LOC130918721 isoform X3 [Corythoichthys intestinalis]
MEIEERKSRSQRTTNKLKEMKCPTDVTVEDHHHEKHDPLHFKQEEDSEMPYIKQEAESENPDMKEEDQEVGIPKFPMGVGVKSEEDEGPSEESRAANPLSDSSFQHVTTKGDQPDSLSAPLSDSDDITSHSSDFNNDEEEDDFDQNASKSSNKSSLKRDKQQCAVGKPFTCTLCGLTVTVGRNHAQQAITKTRTKASVLLAPVPSPEKCRG